MYWNVRGWTNKLSEPKQEIQDYNESKIICIGETSLQLAIVRWLSTVMYVNICNQSTKGRRGGITCFIHKSVFVDKTITHLNDRLDYISSEWVTNNQKHELQHGQCKFP